MSDQNDVSPEVSALAKDFRLQIVYVPIDSLIPADYNPREATEAQVFQLKENISKFGFVDPVIVNSAPGRNNIIIGGHFRVRVAKQMGYTQVPAVFLNIPAIELEKELNVRLNKNTGQFNLDMLANNFNMEALQAWGFTTKDLGLEPAKKMVSFEAKLGKEPAAIPLTYEITFETHKAQEEFLEYMAKIEKMYDVPAADAILRFFRERLN